MNKRILILISDGMVYQRGKPLPLSPAITDENVRKDAESLFVASIDFLISDEQDNFYQIIALPLPGTPLAEANKSFTVDIPERRMPVPLHDTAADDAKGWIRKQRDLDKQESEEDLKAAQEEEEESEEDEDREEERSQEPETAVPTPQLSVPQLTQALPPAPVAVQPASAVALAAQVVVPQPAPAQPAAPPPGQLEVLAPVPINIPGLSGTS